MPEGDSNFFTKAASELKMRQILVSVLLSGLAVIASLLKISDMLSTKFVSREVYNIQLQELQEHVKMLEGENAKRAEEIDRLEIYFEQVKKN